MHHIRKLAFYIAEDVYFDCSFILQITFCFNSFFTSLSVYTYLLYYKFCNLKLNNLFCVDVYLVFFRYHIIATCDCP